MSASPTPFLEGTQIREQSDVIRLVKPWANATASKAGQLIKLNTSQQFDIMAQSATHVLQNAFIVDFAYTQNQNATGIRHGRVRALVDSGVAAGDYLKPSTANAGQLMTATQASDGDSIVAYAITGNATGNTPLADVEFF